jgi:hypothetical protein
MNGDSEAMAAESYYSDVPGTEPIGAGEMPGAMPASKTQRGGKPGHYMDAPHRAWSAQERRIDGAEAAVAAGVVVNQVDTTFPGFTRHPVVRAALPIVPLVMLRPTARGVRDPRLLAGTAVVGLAIAAEITGKSKPSTPSSLKVIRSLTTPLQANERDLLSAEARDEKGRPVNTHPVQWTSSDDAVATVDADSGEVEAIAPGSAKITATTTVDGTALMDSIAVIVR